MGRKFGRSGDADDGERLMILRRIDDMTADLDSIDRVANTASTRMAVIAGPRRFDAAAGDIPFSGLRFSSPAAA